MLSKAEKQVLKDAFSKACLELSENEVVSAPPGKYYEYNYLHEKAKSVYTHTLEILEALGLDSEIYEIKEQYGL